MAKQRTRLSGRLTFVPSVKARAYFDDLVERVTKERRLEVRATYREVFDVMVEYARKGGPVYSQQPLPLEPPLRPPVLKQ